ncbi:MAG TPA: hypothetical protein V6D13_09290 [Halomicronema sp.]
MFPQSKIAKFFFPFATSLLLTAIYFKAFRLISPAYSHEVEISGDVAATFHIEPNHNPKAGQPTQAWFALTRKGGTIIPLNDCNCQLAVYSLPRRPNTQPILKPTLKSINAEKYKGIPGAEITFPKADSYQLEISGNPKESGKFKPFKLTFEVNVSK